MNLSHNDISGSIPQSFGGLEKLEILDVSYNNLSGKIPQTLSRLSELDVLDLSNNKLSDRIPGSSQLDRLNDPNIYANNSKICGTQIQVSCSTTRTEQQPKEEDEEEKEATVPWEAVVIRLFLWISYISFVNVCSWLFQRFTTTAISKEQRIQVC